MSTSGLSVELAFDDQFTPRITKVRLELMKIELLRRIRLTYEGPLKILNEPTDLLIDMIWGVTLCTR